MAQLVLYVDPERGQDSREGRSPDQPLKTITAALRLSQSDTRIQLKAGLYTASSGEQFPLVIPAGCEVVGEMGGDRPSAVIQGGGPVQHPVLGTQSMTCRLPAGATLKQVTIVNTQGQGSGILLEAGRPRLEKVVVMKCPQYGVVALGKVLPTVQDCVLEDCGVAGIACLTQSKGQFERVFCQNNQTGLLIQDAAAPFIVGCSLERNRLGMAIAGTANPVLRDNRIRNNQTVGLQLLANGTADLGQSQDVGNNVIRHNGQVDIQNRTGRSLVSCGNDVLPQRVEGKVDLIASEIPDPSAVPAMLFDQPASFPAQEPSERPTPEREAPAPTPQPAPTSVRFTDMADHWAAPFVEGLAAAEAVAGFQDGTFRPNQSVTRAEFAAFVVASFPNQPVRNSAIRFSDVPRAFWGYAALTQVQQMGFLSGFPDGTMRPNEPMTRIQAIVAVTNGLGLTGGRVDDIGIYRDRAQIPSYAVDALATATRQRLVVNYPDPLVLRPLEPISRGEVSALIYQGRVAQGKSSAIASPYIVQPDATQPLFSDLTGHWAAEFIRGLAEVNLVSGMEDGRFAPDQPMNRAQFAALVVKAFEPQPAKPPAAFTDVPSSYWGFDAIQAAYRGEFMSGFPDQTFAPENPLLRVQTWVALVNGLNWEDPDVDVNPLGQFEDYTTLPRYAFRQSAIALQRHLIASYPDTSRLRPNQNATRAEVCVAVYQALVALQRLPAIASEYVV
jgi:parallel beta-helix repeat protein